MQVTLCLITPQGVTHQNVEVAQGTSCAALLAQCGVSLAEGDALAIFAKPVTPEKLLMPGDRLEVAPALLVDPMVARRYRAAQQGDVRVTTSGRHGGRHRLQK